MESEGYSTQKRTLGRPIKKIMGKKDGFLNRWFMDPIFTYLAAFSGDWALDTLTQQDQGLDPSVRGAAIGRMGSSILHDALNYNLSDTPIGRGLWSEPFFRDYIFSPVVTALTAYALSGDERSMVLGGGSAILAELITDAIRYNASQ